MRRKAFSLALAVLLLVPCAISGQSYDWSSCAQASHYKWAGFIFNNCRWSGLLGCMYLDTGKTITYWTDHTENFQCCSAPWVSIGSDNWGEWADNTSLPRQIKNFSICKSNWEFTIPPIKNPANPEFRKYHFYYQLYFFSGPSLTSSRAGDFAIVIHDENFYHGAIDGWPNRGTHTIAGYPMEVHWAGPSGQGPFLLMEIYPNPTPVNGIIKLKNFDIKACLDWAVSQGYYSGNEYVAQISTAFEVMTLQNRIKTNDVSYVVGSPGEAPIYTPAWASTYFDLPSGVAARFSATPSSGPRPLAGRTVPEENSFARVYDIRGKLVSAAVLSDRFVPAGVFVTKDQNGWVALNSRISGSPIR